MSEFWNKLFDWLERVLPTAIGTFFAGYKLGSNKTKEVENVLAKTEYELEKAKNEAEILKQQAVDDARKIADDVINGNATKGKKP